MFLEVFLVILGSVFYFLYWQPKKRIQKFAKDAESKGYKVKLMPFNFMGFYLPKMYDQDKKSLRIFKQEIFKYDILVGNFLTQLSILPINTTILKDIFNQISKFPKSDFGAQVFQLLEGGGIVFTQGQVWKRKRRIISSVFHYEFLNQIIPVIDDIVNLKCQQIQSQIKNGQNIDIQNKLIQITSAVVSRLFFGTDVNLYLIEGKPYCQQLMKFLDQMFHFLTSTEHVIFGMKCYNWQLTQRSRSLKRKLDIFVSIAKQVTQSQVNKLKSGQKLQKSILVTLYQNNLLNQCIGNKKNVDQYSLSELVGQFLIFFVAGTDTTSNSVNLAFHYLSQYPQYVQEIRKQLEQLNKDNQKTKPQKFRHMKWMQAIFNQTLRINGPVISLFPRKVVNDVTVGGLSLFKGTGVSIMPLINNYGLQYFEKPHQFIPERWMQSKKVDPFAFIPFSIGQRNCIGQYLARLQAKIIMQKIIQKFQFKAISQIKMEAGFVYATKKGIFQMKIRTTQE